MERLKRTAAIILAFVFVISAGCDSAPKSRLVGTWKIDNLATKGALPANAMQNQIIFWESIIDGSSLTIDFNSDHTYEGYSIAVGKKADFKGKWSVVEDSGETMIIKLTEEGSNQSETRKFTFVSPDLLIFDGGAAAATDEIVPRLRRQQ